MGFERGMREEGRRGGLGGVERGRVGGSGRRFNARFLTRDVFGEGRGERGVGEGGGGCGEVV